MKGKRENWLARSGGIRGQMQESDAVMAGKRIGTRAKNCDIVLCVGRDNCESDQRRRAVRARDQNGGLAAVLEGFQNVRDRQQIALIIDEERIAKKSVMIAMRCGRFVKAINDGADRCAQRAIGAGVGQLSSPTPAMTCGRRMLLAWS